MYKIIEELQNDLPRLKISDESSGEYVSIIPMFGANINELVLRKGPDLITLLDGNSRKEQFMGSGIYNSAKLLPFPNRVADGLYKFENKKYQLHINFPGEGNAIHGLVYDQPFRLIGKKTEETYAEVVLRYSWQELCRGYPFIFDVDITCRLQKEKGFLCSTQVHNSGKQPMPFADGWHPFFTFNKAVDELHLQFTAEELIVVDDRLIPTGETKKYRQFNTISPIGNIAFDSCFRLAEVGEKHLTGIYDPVTDVKILLWQETGPGKYNYLQVYTPSARHSIALEPMTCNVNAFNNQEGLIILEPDEVFQASYGVRVE
jgi:aldose 1-epimerase